MKEVLTAKEQEFIEENIFNAVAQNAMGYLIKLRDPNNNLSLLGLHTKTISSHTEDNHSALQKAFEFLDSYKDYFGLK